MGQKANPKSLRLGINRDWDSRWYAPNQKTWSLWLVQDKKIRNYFDSYTKEWALSNIEIDRTTLNIKVTINTAKPGVVLGIEGANVAVIQKEVSKALKNNKKLQNELGHKIINTLNRYRKNGINEKEAIEAAKNIASYFNLDEHFIRKTITYAKDSNKILQIKTTHVSKDLSNKRHNILQSEENISITSRSNTWTSIKEATFTHLS